MTFMDDVARASKPYRPGRPHEVGTLVTGWTRNGIFGIIGHKDHIFEVGPSRRLTEPEPHWRQRARCVVCDVEIPECSSDFYEVKATKEDVDQVLRWITDERRRLAKARRQLAEWKI